MFFDEHAIVTIGAVASRGDRNHVRACLTVLYALLRTIYGTDLLRIVGFSDILSPALQAQYESLSRFGPDAPRVLILADVRGQRADIATKLTIDAHRVRLYIKVSPTVSGYISCTERVELMVSARDSSITWCNLTEHDARMSRNSTLLDTTRMVVDVSVSWLEIVNIRYASFIRFLIWFGRQLTVSIRADSFWEIYRTFILPIVLDSRLKRRATKATIVERPLDSLNTEIK